MKKKIRNHYLLLISLALLFCACNKNEEMDNLVCFQTGGCVSVHFSHLDNEVEQTINVVNRSLEASVTQINLFSQEELAAYNKRNATDYQLMPSNTYQLGETNVAFSKGENAKETTIKMYPGKLFDVVRKDSEKREYAIPLKLSNQSVPNDNSIAIYVIDMDYPELRIEEGKDIRLMKKETDISLKIRTYQDDKIVSNQDNIDLNLALPDNAGEWLRMYNDTSDVKYQLLPVGAYELGKVTGIKGEDKCDVSVKIKRTLSSGSPLEYGRFILPVKLAGEDKNTALNHDVCVLKVNNPNSYDDVLREYDDGENIIFRVKIMIDKEGLELMDNDMEFFRNGLANRWDEVNKRFNGLDKKGILKRNYIFVPDLEDIIVTDDMGDNYWNAPTIYADRIDVEKFQLVVSYDCVQEASSGGGGGGIPISHIRMPYYGRTRQEILNYWDVTSRTALHVESLVHEIGHFRGLIDTYWCELSASDNLITHQGFWAEKGNMMGACYEPLETAIWSDYEMYVINAAGCKNVDIHAMMAKYFPDDVEITVTENGQPIEGCTLNFYPKDYGNSKVEKMSQSYTLNGSKITLNAKVPLFWPYQSWYEEFPHTYNRLLLAEAISTKTGKKGYIFIPVYEVHKQGLLDKAENKIIGRSVYKATININ